LESSYVAGLAGSLKLISFKSEKGLKRGMTKFSKQILSSQEHLCS